MSGHHAVLLLGTCSSQANFLFELKSLDTKIEMLKFEVLVISDVRKIIKEAFLKPFVHQTKTLVIEANSIATEAQQALLKVLEEPPLTTKFVLILKSKEGLLQTLLSRLSLLNNISFSEMVTNDVFSNFIELSLADRLEFIAKITKNKDVETIELLRDGVVKFLTHNPLAINREVLEMCAITLRQKGAGKKMLLEEIALTIACGT